MKSASTSSLNELMPPAMFLGSGEFLQTELLSDGRARGMGVKKTGKGRRKLGRKKRKMRSKIRHRK